jgi:hypothetical protein
MSLTIARTASQLSATTSFQGSVSLMSSTVSSSFVVPANVSRIVSIDMAVTADGAEESATLFRCAGNGMGDGEQFAVAGAIVNAGSATGTATNYVTKLLDWNVISGNSIELAVAVTDASVISYVAVLTFQ